MAKKYSGGTETKRRILYTAVELFNERGSAAVSTNHIAKAAGISPGNLYYHFKNKEEIIRSILEVMVADWESLYQPPADRLSPEETLRAIFRHSFSLIWRFRFFYREQIALMQRDPLLAARNQAITMQRLKDQKHFAQQLADGGILRHPIDWAGLEQTLTVAWIVSTWWLTFQETLGIVPGEEQFEEGIGLLFHLFQPYLVE